MLKKCFYCKELKSTDSDYYTNSARSDGYQTYCITCSSKRRKKRYAERSTEEKAQVKAARQRLRKESTVKIVDHFLKHPCVDCGESDPLYLEFDHVRGKKSKDVAKLVSDGAAWIRIEEEIQKCDVRCVKCHRKRTYKLLGTLRYNELVHRGMVQPG